MPELELVRSDRDRRLYTLGDSGSLRLEGLFSRSATAEARGGTWRFETVGVFTRRALATDVSGSVVGGFEPRTLRRGGDVQWSGRELKLRPAGSWRERYALVDDDDELAVFDARAWGRRPVRITLAETQTVDPALLLFAAFVVRGLAADANTTAAAGASTAATGAG